jgi:hypothetical protein
MGNRQERTNAAQMPWRVVSTGTVYDGLPFGPVVRQRIELPGGRAIDAYH